MPRAARLVVLLYAVAACVRAAAASPAAAGASPDAAPDRTASGAAIAEYVRARLAEGRGDSEGAIRALRRALVDDPESPQLRISYAEALARGAHLDAAEGEARRAVELARAGAAAADAHLVLGKVLASRGRSDAAERELETAARIEAARPRDAAADDGPAIDPEPWRALVRVRLARGDVAGALKACDELAPIDRAAAAAALRDGAGRLLEGGNASAAERLARRGLELLPGDGAAWKLLARAQQEQHRTAEARDSVQRALQADPADGEALLVAGQLAVGEGDLASARAWFRQLLRVAPDETDAQVRVASAWLDAKHPAEALEVVGSGDAPELLYLRGVALARLRRWADAAAVLGRIEPSAGELYPGSRAMLAHVLSRAGRTAEALQAVRSALERDPRQPVLLFALGETYDRAGQREAALAQMREVLALKPDDAEALNYLGYAYAERGERLEEAEGMVRHALRLDPDNAYFLDSLGWVLFKRGDAPGAVEALERAASLAAEPTILDHLGDAYRAAQRTADAASAYRRALQAPDPDDEEPGASSAARRASLQRKLDELGAHETRAANLR